MTDTMFRWILVGYGATVAFGILSIGLYLREISDHLMHIRELTRMDVEIRTTRPPLMGGMQGRLR